MKKLYISPSCDVITAEPCEIINSSIMEANYKYGAPDSDEEITIMETTSTNEEPYDWSKEGYIEID